MPKMEICRCYRMVSVIVFLLYVSHAVQCADTNIVATQRAMVNQSVTLPCHTVLNVAVDWWYQATLTDTVLQVCMNGEIVSTLRDRFLVDSSKPGDYNLVINAARMSDAGYYTCVEDAGLSTRHVMNLKVVADVVNSATIPYTTAAASAAAGAHPSDDGDLSASTRQGIGRTSPLDETFADESTTAALVADQFPTTYVLIGASIAIAIIIALVVIVTVFCVHCKQRQPRQPPIENDKSETNLLMATASTCESVRSKSPTAKYEDKTERTDEAATSLSLRPKSPTPASAVSEDDARGIDAAVTCDPTCPKSPASADEDTTKTKETLNVNEQEQVSALSATEDETHQSKEPPVKFQSIPHKSTTSAAAVEDDGKRIEAPTKEAEPMLTSSASEDKNASKDAKCSHQFSSHPQLRALINREQNIVAVTCTSDEIFIVDWTHASVDVYHATQSTQSTRSISLPKGITNITDMVVWQTQCALFLAEQRNETSCLGCLWKVGIAVDVNINATKPWYSRRPSKIFQPCRLSITQNRLAVTTIKGELIFFGPDGKELSVVQLDYNADPYYTIVSPIDGKILSSLREGCICLKSRNSKAPMPIHVFIEQLLLAFDAKCGAFTLCQLDHNIYITTPDLSDRRLILERKSEGGKRLPVVKGLRYIESTGQLLVAEPNAVYIYDVEQL